MKKAQPRTDQDSAWKDVLELFCKDFVEYCLPELYALVNWQRAIEFLDKELHKITKEGLTGNRLVDKLVKVFLKDGEEIWVLIHIEVQGEPDEALPSRMYIYATRLHDKYRKPILSCAILTDTSQNWRPDHYESNFLGSKLRLDFQVIKLLDYQDRILELESSKNPFASVILIQLEALKTKRKPAEERKELKIKLTKRLYNKGFSKVQIRGLYSFIDWLINLPNELEQNYFEEVYELEVNTMPYITSIERFGIEKGMQQGLLIGRQEGESLLLLRLLTRKFGEIPKRYQERVAQADAEMLLIWGEKILDAKTLPEVFEEISS